MAKYTKKDYADEVMHIFTLSTGIDVIEKNPNLTERERLLIHSFRLLEDTAQTLVKMAMKEADYDIDSEFDQLISERATAIADQLATRMAESNSFPETGKMDS